MGPQFAPPVVRWLAFACIIVLVLALLAMPREERARLLRGARRRGALRLPPSTAQDLWASPATGDASFAEPSRELPLENLQPMRKLGIVAIAARFVLAGSAVVMIALVLWMTITFVLNIPGWR